MKIMATNETRSLNGGLNEGATDGKYRKVRPNTEVAADSGDDLTLANRRALNPYWNYDFIDQEAQSKVNPLSTSASSKPRSPMPVADTFNNQMGAAF
jgi:hypothetical protein